MQESVRFACSHDPAATGGVVGATHTLGTFSQFTSVNNPSENIWRRAEAQAGVHPHRCDRGCCVRMDRSAERTEDTANVWAPQDTSTALLLNPPPVEEINPRGQVPIFPAAASVELFGRRLQCCSLKRSRWADIGFSFWAEVILY